MKRFVIALSMMAALSLAACANGTGWTPMSSGRTAGKGTVEKSSKADRSFNGSLRK